MGDREAKEVDLANVFWVSGPQRSGTTLMQQILQSNLPRCPNLVENSFVTGILRAYKTQFGDLSKVNVVFGSDEELKDFTGRILAHYVAMVSRRFPGSEYLVIKDPGLIALGEHLLDFCSPTRVVLMARNPYDIFRSHMRIGNRESRSSIGSRKYVYGRTTLNALMSKINMQFSDLLVAVRSGQNVFLYEDLVKDPLETISQISNISGVPLRSTTKLEWPAVETLHKPSWRSELVGGPISSASLRRRKEKLTREVVDGLAPAYEIYSNLAT